MSGFMGSHVTPTLTGSIDKATGDDPILVILDSVGPRESLDKN